MSELTRKEVQRLKRVITEAVRRESFEDFKNILVQDLKLELGSEAFRSYESLFWQAVAARRNEKRQRRS